MLPGGQLALADIVGAHHALAVRLAGEFADWILREGSKAPPAATALARLAEASARRMAQNQERLDADVKAGVQLDPDDFLGVAAKTTSIEEIHTLLEHVSYASLHPVLSPTVLAELEDLGIEGQVLVAGTRENVSYELATYERDNFRGLVSDELLDDVEWPIHVFLVPNRPVAWSLHHVLLYHEVGHAAHMEPPQIAVPPELQTVGEDEDLFKRIEQQQAVDAYFDSIARWAEEAFADAVGVMLAGPAYAVAFCRFIGSHFGLDVASPTHLPNALRIILIARVLEQRGFDEHLQPPLSSLLQDWTTVADQIHARGAYTPTEDGQLFERVLPLLLSNVPTLHAEIIKQASALVGAQAYTVAHYSADQARAEELYQHRIPAIEVNGIPSLQGAGEPLSPARVFSVSWAAYLLALRDSDSMTTLSAQSGYHADALLGSLEGADALRAWRRQS